MTKIMFGASIGYGADQKETFELIDFDINEDVWKKYTEEEKEKALKEALETWLYNFLNVWWEEKDE